MTYKNVDQILSLKNIKLKSEATTQKEVFQEIAEIAFRNKYIKNKQMLVDNLFAREKLGSTGMENYVAIPHTLTKNILKTQAIIIQIKDEIKDWVTLDKKPVKFVIALLCRKHEVQTQYIKMLSSLSARLIDSSICLELIASKSKEKILEIFSSNGGESAETVSSQKLDKKIIAITACPVGVAHTYMAAEAITKAANKLGYSSKVETQGSQGTENALTVDDVVSADVLILANDIGIDLNRFYNNVKVYNAKGSTRIIKNAEAVIKEALEKATILTSGAASDKNIISDTKKSKNNNDVFAEIYGSGGPKANLLQHLMAGVSYMVPIVILGGILIALSAGIGKAVYGIGFDPGANNKNVFYYMNAIGAAAFTLMIPILGAFIANSIAGRAAIAPALVVSFIGNSPQDLYPILGSKIDTPTGFLGAIAVGLAIGYTVRWMNTWKVHRNIRAIMPLFVIPILCGVVFGAIMMFAIGAPLGYIMGKFKNWIQTSWKGTNGSVSIGIGLGLGTLIGAMTGFDMGGPVNKIAFLSCVALLSEHIYNPMGAMMCAIPVAPLGMGLATWIFRPYFNSGERVMGNSALVMGFIGISEGAIPFAVRDPKRVIPCNILGSLVAGAIGGVLGISDAAAQGGPIMAFLGAVGRNNDIGFVYWYWGLVSIAIMSFGALITCFSYGIWLSISRTNVRTPKSIIYLKKGISFITEKFRDLNKISKKGISKSSDKMHRKKITVINCLLI